MESPSILLRGVVGILRTVGDNRKGAEQGATSGLYGL